MLEIVLRALKWQVLLLGTTMRVLAAGWRRILKSRTLAGQISRPSTPTRRPRVLIVAPYEVVPAHHGAAVRILNLVRLLSRECDLYLLVFIQGEDDQAHREGLEPWVAGVWFFDWRLCWQTPAAAVKLAPPSARLFFDERAALKIRDIIESHDIDVVQLEGAEMAQYRHSVGDVPVIVVEHDVAFRSFRRRLKLRLPQRYPVSKAFGATFGDWMRLLRYEVTSCRDVAQLHMMSSADAEYLACFMPDSTARIRVVPNGVDTVLFCPPDPAPRRRGVLMVGNFRTLPNLDAFAFFADEIWPRVRLHRPDARLSVIGADMPSEMYEWSGRDGISVIGTVPEMRDSYHGHEVLVVPLRVGSGTRLKIVEAFASGIPVVSTTIGMEGIDCVGGVDLLIADEAADFADAIERLLSDCELAEGIAMRARQVAMERYDWSTSAQANLAGISELLSVEPRPKVNVTPLIGTVPHTCGGATDSEIAISVIIPCFRGGAILRCCLEALSVQKCEHSFEVVCIDSGSGTEDLETMREFGVRAYGIERRFFNHGLTRDLGAELAVGEVIVFTNQDVIAADDRWLDQLTAPLFASQEPPAAAQGVMQDLPEDSCGLRPFFWNTSGERFYFTREAKRWVSRVPGPSLSTVCLALRREVWAQLNFGWAPTMEDKKWQRSALEAGLGIVEVPEARVFHSHAYTVASLVDRCRSEGFGWRLLGERYTLRDATADLWAPHLWRDLGAGLWRGKFRLSMAEVLFPWLRPIAVWYGNQQVRDLNEARNQRRVDG